MRIALIHDWLTGMRGGEKVLEAFTIIFPNAPIYTLFCQRDKISPSLARRQIKTSFLQHFPFTRRYYRHYLPFFPKAVESFNLDSWDVVISNSHCVAKGVRTGRETLHICYCLSPMRYIWDRFDDYFPAKRTFYPKLKAIKAIAGRLRRWDVESSKRVDLFVAISQFVRQRIERYYGRPSVVIHPPVDTDFYTPGQSNNQGDFFLAVGTFAPYKKTELVIEAFRGLGERLMVIGDPAELRHLSANAPSNVTFLGRLDDESLRDCYRRCRALVFPGVEDFGIMPVEAQACGKPVIAFAEGGLRDSVIGPVIGQNETFDGEMTGLFFPEQSVASIRQAVGVFQGLRFQTQAIRQNALRFSRQRFINQMTTLLEEAFRVFRDQGKIGFEERMIR